MDKTLILFDWDGTLVDTHTAAPAIQAEVFAAMGMPVTVKDMIRLFGQSGINLVQSVRAMHNLEKLPNDDPVVMAQFHDFERLEGEGLYKLYHTKGARLFPGARTLLQKLSGNPAYVLGIASNGLTPTVGGWIDMFELRPIFGNRIYGPDLVEFRGKPQPDMVQFASIDNGVSVNQTILIGDTLNDMGAAASAGATGILIQHDGVYISDTARQLARYQIHDYAEIEPLLHTMQAKAA